MSSEKERKQTRIIRSDQTGEEIIEALQPSAGEVHLQQYPIFQITTAKSNENRHIYEERILTKDGAEITRRWAVEVSDHYGWPGQHEAEVWRSVEHIIELRARRRMLENPLRTTFSEIYQHMPGKRETHGKTNWQRIKNSLSVLKNTGVEASFFYRKEDRTRQGTEFDVIDDVSYGYRYEKNGEPVLKDDGTPVIDYVEITINKHLWSNIENRYVRPVDRGYRARLSRWSSRRLYEILGGRFFARRKKDEMVKLRYSQICALLGSKEQEYLSKAKQIMGRYHTELMETEPPFLSAVEWHEMSGRDNDWMLIYHPGPKAIAEWEQKHWRTKRTSEALFIEGNANVPFERDPVWVEDMATVRVAVTSERDEVQAYQDAARNIFSKLTGTERAWDDKDKGLLVSLQREGVTLDDIREGIKACTEERQAASMRRHAPLFRQHTDWGKGVAGELKPIRTLRYCESHIWEAFRARESTEEQQEKKAVLEEREEAAKETYERLKKSQSEDLARRQEELLSMVTEALTDKAFERHFSDLILVAEEDGQLVWQARGVEKARYLRAFYEYFMEKTWRRRIEIRPSGDD